MPANLIIESCEKARNISSTSIVHVRNSLILADVLDADFISHESQVNGYADKKYDNIVCMYASHYMKWKKYLPIIENNPQAKLYWLVNDHDLEDNTLLRKAVTELNRTYDVVCNNPRSGYRHWILNKNLHGKKLNDFIVDWHTLNLNALIFDDTLRGVEFDMFRSEKSGCIYYGTFRKWRTGDMLRFADADYVISTSIKNQHKYLEAGINDKFIDKISWESEKEDLNNFKYSIYFEDVHTHDNYAFMANRYYECLMCGVLIFFDSRCENTVFESGYIIDPFLMVSDGMELNEKMARLDSDPEFYQSLIASQRSNVAKINREKEKVISDIRSIFNA